VKQRATADHAKPVTRTVKPSIESALTLEQVREAVEMAWTDATNLPDHIENGELCQHLGNAAACLDEMIEREGKRRR
jgi:hypothetical protein